MRVYRAAVAFREGCDLPKEPGTWNRDAARSRIKGLCRHGCVPTFKSNVMTTIWGHVALQQRGLTATQHCGKRIGRQRVGLHSPIAALPIGERSEEHTSELKSLMRISYAVFCLT